MAGQTVCLWRRGSRGVQPGWLARAARGQAGRPTQQGGSGMVRFTDSPAGWASPVLSENSSVGCLVLHFSEWHVFRRKAVSQELQGLGNS